MHTTEMILVTVLTWSLNEGAALYKEVLVNKTTNISCFSNEDIQIQWHHTTLGGSINYVYAGGKFYDSSNRGYRLEKDSNTGPYRLVIPNAKYEDAGLYECKEDIGSRVFGSTQLTVLESSPFCGSNMKPQGFVGPNTCNLEQEYMTFTCAVSFSGKAPQMIWTILNDSQSFNESTCKNANGRINCSLIVRADSKYDGTIFNCQSTKSSANCNTKIIKIQYFESDFLLVEKNIQDKVNCSVKSNQVLQFKWNQLQGNQYVTLVTNQTLLIPSPGFYRCIVEYRIRNITCSAFGSEVNVHKTSTYLYETGQAGATASIVLSIIVVICIVLFAVFYRLQRKTLKQEFSTRFESCIIVAGFDNYETICQDVVKIKINGTKEVYSYNIKPLPPQMQRESAAAVYGNSLFITGLEENCDQIWKFDARSSNWEYCNSMILGRRRHSVAFVDHVLYICGGLVDAGKITLNDVEAYDTIDDRCTNVGKLVHAVEGAGNCVPLKSSLYIFGGLDYSDKDIDYVQVYDTKLNTCTLLSKRMPVAFRLFRAVLWENNAILLGYDNCLIYNFDKGTWQMRDQLMTDVVHFGMIIHNGKLLVIGGGDLTVDVDGNKKWIYRDDVRSVPVENVLNNESIEWLHHSKLPKPTAVFNFGKMEFPLQ